MPKQNLRHAPVQPLPPIQAPLQPLPPTQAPLPELPQALPLSPLLTALTRPWVRLRSRHLSMQMHRLPALAPLLLLLRHSTLTAMTMTMTQSSEARVQARLLLRPPRLLPL